MNAALSSTKVPDFLKLLAHELRWKILTALAYSDRSVQEIVQFLQEPQNVVSYHLRKLREQALVKERRSNADERSLYYSLDLEQFRMLYLLTGEVFHPALGKGDFSSKTPNWNLPKPAVRVLFLCTQNSARSQLAEALTRHLSNGQVEVVSAGTEPRGIHPLTYRVLSTFGIDASQQQAKHVDEIRDQTFDYVITVCDKVREVCPTWPSEPECIHWSFADPVVVEGSEEERYQAFEQITLQLMQRIRFLFALIEQKQTQSLQETAHQA
jgi:ArsR family transcriptional regulator, arsenate/arsenite/antimonite-responsive transcriptional repressor / arsenate reductase (thioredoxin)